MKPSEPREGLRAAEGPRDDEKPKQPDPQSGNKGGAKPKEGGQADGVPRNPRTDD